MLRCAEHNINRKAHEEHMHHAAGLDDQSLAGLKLVSSKQSLESRKQIIRD